MSTRRSFLKVIGVATIGVVAPNTSGERATRGNPDQTQHLTTGTGLHLDISSVAVALTTLTSAFLLDRRRRPCPWFRVTTAGEMLSLVLLVFLFLEGCLVVLTAIKDSENRYLVNIHLERDHNAFSVAGYS